MNIPTYDEWLTTLKDNGELRTLHREYCIYLLSKQILERRWLCQRMSIFTKSDAYQANQAILYKLEEQLLKLEETDPIV